MMLKSLAIHYPSTFDFHYWLFLQLQSKSTFKLWFSNYVALTNLFLVHCLLELVLDEREELTHNSVQYSDSAKWWTILLHSFPTNYRPIITNFGIG